MADQVAKFKLDLDFRKLNVNINDATGLVQEDPLLIQSCVTLNKVCLDWRLYECIVFLLVQNAVKYSKEESNIQVTLKFVPKSQFDPDDQFE